MILIKLLIVSYVLLLSNSVIAHTGLQSSIPSNGDVLKEAPKVIELSYGGPINLIKVELKGADGNVIDVDIPSDNMARKHFTLPLTDIQTSAYQVSWISAGADGHKITGKFAFKYIATNAVENELENDNVEFINEGISPWALVSSLNKLFLYIALAMTIGGLSAKFTLSRSSNHHTQHIRYILMGCILGVFTACLSFFLQVGAFTEEGIAGMWSLDFMPILWDSGAGQALRFQLIGWGLILMTLFMHLKIRFNYIFLVLSLIGSLIIATSFSLTGHTAEAPLWVKISLILHVAIAMWWMGLLYPLRSACDVLDTSNLQSLMIDFGKKAIFLVCLLIALGVGVAYHLEGSISNLLFTGHGNVLLLKLVSVAVILLIATKHKLRLVPSLTNLKAVLILKRSITIEMIIGFIILLITTVLSSLVGPAYS